MKKTGEFFLVTLASCTFILLFITALGFSLQGTRTRDNEVKVILTGDVMLGRSVMTRSLTLADPTYPFAKMAERLTSVDLVFINLENPIIEGCPWNSGGMIFCADPVMVEGLTFAGVDVVTLANNHSSNWGQAGTEQTKEILAANDISVTGLGNLVVKEVNGITFGFLGFDFVSQNPKGDDFAFVAEVDRKVDILVVGVHWGVEYQPIANQYQREWARQVVEAGADVVVGHHPHWVQDMEYINNRPVYYSLGNFVFDQMWSQKTREGMVIELTFDESGLVKEEKLPTYISSWAQPEFVE